MMNQVLPFDWRPIHGVNHIDVNTIDGVCFKEIQVFMTHATDHAWLVMMKAMRALTRYAAAGIEETGSASRISAYWKSCCTKGLCP
jgi:hypothetical protein